MVGKARQAVDWHGIVFMASLGVAAVLMAYQGISQDGRIRTIFEAEHRRQLARYIRRHVFDYREAWRYLDATK